MRRLAHSDDYQPVAWIGQIPIYTPWLLLIVHIVTALLTTALIGLEKTSLLAHLAFSSSAITHDFAIWQFVTYAFLHEPSFSFVVEMFTLYYFGREVERFVGRRAFLSLYGLLLLLPPCVLTAAGAFAPVHYHGSQILHFCLFIAFACLYPSVELFFSIQARWIAGCLFAVYFLQMLAGHAWDLLCVLGLSAFIAFYFIGRLRYGFEMPGGYQVKNWLQAIRPTRRRKEPGHLSSPPAQLKQATSDDLASTVDRLLEKISLTGIGSLTEKERGELTKASEKLKGRKGSPSRL